MWWQNMCLYEIYVPSFMDSDGDGLGDIIGARSKFDYLVDLGVDAIWLTPFYPSPMRDHGYDVSDYCNVE
jgi:alpha-glucosidase